LWRHSISHNGVEERLALSRVEAKHLHQKTNRLIIIIMTMITIIYIIIIRRKKLHFWLCT